ncbi:hypothetical protein F4679DRAFT_588648 [Xylaria curta]|nr:hypothetical protein F4679DRAFT_588648 [Xylaria curta]
MASSIEELRVTMESTVTHFLDSPAQALAAQDSSLYLATLTEECTHYLRPLQSVASNPLLKAVKSNEEYKALMESALPTIEDTRVEIKEFVIDPLKQKASVLAEHCTKIVSVEANIMEITWFLDFTEDGNRISRVVEFIDTAIATKRIVNMKKHGFSKDEGSGQ